MSNVTEDNDKVWFTDSTIDLIERPAEMVIEIKTCSKVVTRNCLYLQYTYHLRDEETFFSQILVKMTCIFIALALTAGSIPLKQSFLALFCKLSVFSNQMCTKVV